MAYKEFKMPAALVREPKQTVATVASVAGVHVNLQNASRAQNNATAKVNIVINQGEKVFSSVELGVATVATVGPNEAASVQKPAAAMPVARDRIFRSTRATVATFATLNLGAYRLAFDTFRAYRPYGITRFRHDQAVWAAEIFLNEWVDFAAELGWPVEDIFNRNGLIWWLGVEIVRALGPEHAVTEASRIYDRLTHRDWVNPYGSSRSN
jgi:hypothetical protein